MDAVALADGANWVHPEISPLMLFCYRLATARRGAACEYSVRKRWGGNSTNVAEAAERGLNCSVVLAVKSVSGGVRGAHVDPDNRPAGLHAYRKDCLQALKPIVDLVVKDDAAKAKRAGFRAHDDATR